MEHFDYEYAKIKEGLPNSNLANTFNLLKAKSETRPLVLYACGDFCNKVIDICKERNIQIKAICDKSKRGSHNGFNIISPDMLKEKYSDAIIAITSIRFADEIVEELTEQGFSEDQLFSFEKVFYQCMSVNAFEKRYLQEYKYAYNFFCDEKSRKIILARIKLILYAENLEPTSLGPCYFELNNLELSPNEVFVQAGCYDGETVEEFINLGFIGCGGGVSFRSKRIPPVMRTQFVDCRSIPMFA